MTPLEGGALVRRAVWTDALPTGADILADFQARLKHPASLPDEATLDALDQAQAKPRRGRLLTY